MINLTSKPRLTINGGSPVLDPLFLWEKTCYTIGMSRTDRVIDDNCYLVASGEPDFIVNINVKRNLLLTCINDVYLESGDKIEIDTAELQKDLIKEYKQEQRRKLKYNK